MTISVTGAGFGSCEENRLVEKAACQRVRSHFEKRGYRVVSREKANLGYDFDVSRNGEVLHVEVKGMRGPMLRFPITGKEKKCATADPIFRIAAVTMARSKMSEIHLLTGKAFLSEFTFEPIAFFAEQKMPRGKTQNPMLAERQRRRR